MTSNSENRPANVQAAEDQAAEDHALRDVAAYFRMDTDPARLTVYRSLMKKLREDIDALEALDLSGLEPAATFDPRWD